MEWIQGFGERPPVRTQSIFPKRGLLGTVGRRSLVTPTADFGSFNFNSSVISLDQMLFDGMYTSNESKRLGFRPNSHAITNCSKLPKTRRWNRFAPMLMCCVTASWWMSRRKTTLSTGAPPSWLRSAPNAAFSGVDVGANGRLALSEFNLVVELTNLHDVSARYLRVVGEKPPAMLPQLPEPFNIGVMPPTVEVLMAEGLQGSPTLNAAVENKLAYRKAIETRKAAYMPRLDLRLYQSRQEAMGGDSSGATLTKAFS